MKFKRNDIVYLSEPGEFSKIFNNKIFKITRMEAERFWIEYEHEQYNVVKDQFCGVKKLNSKFGKLIL